MRPARPSLGTAKPTAKTAKVMIAVSRGRPTPQRAAAIEAAIRDAALEVFLEAGFAGASMEAVARRAQVSKGTLYARHDSKESLFRVVIEGEIGRWADLAGKRDHLLPTELGPRLRQLARALLEVFDWPEYRRMKDLVQSALNSMPSLAFDWEEAGSARYIRFLSADMAEVGGGVPADWDHLAKVFFFSIAGWQRHAVALGRADPDAAAAFADQTVTLIEHAVKRAGRDA